MPRSTEQQAAGVEGLQGRCQLPLGCSSGLVGQTELTPHVLWPFQPTAEREHVHVLLLALRSPVPATDRDLRAPARPASGPRGVQGTRARPRRSGHAGWGRADTAPAISTARAQPLPHPARAPPAWDPFPTRDPSRSPSLTRTSASRPQQPGTIGPVRTPVLPSAQHPQPPRSPGARQGPSDERPVRAIPPREQVPMAPGNARERGGNRGRAVP